MLTTPRSLATPSSVQLFHLPIGRCQESSWNASQPVGFRTPHLGRYGRGIECQSLWQLLWIPLLSPDSTTTQGEKPRFNLLKLPSRLTLLILKWDFLTGTPTDSHRPRDSSSVLVELNTSVELFLLTFAGSEPPNRCVTFRSNTLETVSTSHRLWNLTFCIP